MSYYYHAFTSALSNHGIDAVSEKFAIWARKNRPQWIEEGIVRRVGARIVDEVLFEELKRHWDDAGDDDGTFDGLMSSVLLSSIPECAAHKMAKYARSNPTEESALTYNQYANAKAEQKRAVQTGQTRVSGATMSRGSAIWQLMKACIASQRQVIRRILGLLDVDRFDMVLFDETSQATEVSLMLILTTEWFLDVGLVVLGGDHLQLPPVIKSKAESNFAIILKISHLERSIKVYYDRLFVDVVHDYSSHLRIYPSAPAFTSRVNRESSVRRDGCESVGFYIDPGMREQLVYIDARRRH